jgi:hypothetical protein
MPPPTPSRWHISFVEKIRHGAWAVSVLNGVCSGCERRPRRSCTASRPSATHQGGSPPRRGHRVAPAMMSRTRRRASRPRQPAVRAEAAGRRRSMESCPSGTQRRRALLLRSGRWGLAGALAAVEPLVGFVLASSHRATPMPADADCRIGSCGPNAARATFTFGTYPVQEWYACWGLSGSGQRPASLSRQR